MSGEGRRVATTGATFMKQEDRRSILWLGGVIADPLAAELLRRGEITIVPTSPNNLSGLAPAARGIILEFADDKDVFLDRIQRARDVGLDHGLRIALVRSDKSDEHVFASLVEAPDISREELNRIRWYLPNVWPALAEWMARESPGPGANPLLEIACDADTVLNDEQRLLLQRAFHRFDKLTVKELTGGFSGAKTYRICPTRTAPGAVQRLMPYLAKIGETASIYKEVDNYNLYAAEHIPFNQRPNLNSDLIACGQSSAILVEDFLHEARQFSELWGVVGPGPVVASLFDGALHGWRFNPLRRKSALAEQFKALRVLRYPDTLRDKGAAREEAALASKAYGSTLSPHQLLEIIEKTPAINWCECAVHGDFHAENVFVRTASSETYLIDFSNTASGPAVADPASLEVSLTFRFPPKDRFDRDFVIKLYQYPLSVPAHDLRLPDRDRVWLWDAVRAIRRYVNDEDSRAYVMAIACYLLQAASYDNNDLERRAVAYYLAEKLMRELHKDVGRAVA